MLVAAVRNNPPGDPLPNLPGGAVPFRNIGSEVWACTKIAAGAKNHRRLLPSPTNMFVESNELPSKKYQRSIFIILLKENIQSAYKRKIDQGPCSTKQDLMS